MKQPVPNKSYFAWLGFGLLLYLLLIIHRIELELKKDFDLKNDD